MINEIPDWMQQEESYAPVKDHDNFITKSMLNILTLLERFRENGSVYCNGINAFVKLLYTIYAIVLVSCSKNMFFTYILLGSFLIRICFLKGNQLSRVMSTAVMAGIVSALVMLPSVFLGNPTTMVTIALKVFFSVGMLVLMSVTTRWNRITAALRLLGIPNLFIFTFDLTLKYIALIGEMSRQLLIALKVRSVGRNHKKADAMAGVLGVMFLKSKETSEEVFLAMQCRGFSGWYPPMKKTPVRGRDYLAFVLMGAVMALFLIVEGIVKL
ncbi:energy-coupling factor transporter transmembrane component T [Eubacterium oxidoreducens]|uniref:Cobalt/nickel transport system permease protein n=1 Tax=Eubacterium oxidoreducens TaxID=1732 RepID=A0A1G6AEK7_EUBOX|nr:energy-coupling factor transporter transmembrane component T [Eubacterium oxidoreducens]SDB06533.1 cobalt/nickel transport system permease protein [Eubacterium oxidoreducens]